MAFFNSSRPTSGIVAVVGAIIGVSALGGLVYTEVQKMRTYTPAVAACSNAEHQLRLANKNRKADEEYPPNLDNLLKEYYMNCSPALLEEKRIYDYYSTSAPYWAVVAFPSLAIAGIALTINRRKEE